MCSPLALAASLHADLPVVPTSELRRGIDVRIVLGTDRRREYHQQEH